MFSSLSAEHQRLADSQARRADWKRWGPYVSERAWGTVREDYSADGNAWSYFPHEHARSRAYRWNEDGLAGFCNRFQNVCLAVALWNERDPFLKERLFGLTGHQGNHGEDVKEYYYYLDGTPTHSYMKMLYRYPQVAYPYELLVEENGRRGYHDPEFELIDALRDAFEQGRYFDVLIEYAKADQEDILCRITAINRGPEPAPIHILPHLWFRNTWSWGYGRPKPELRALNKGTVYLKERHLGERWWYVTAGKQEVWQESKRIGEEGESRERGKESEGKRERIGERGQGKLLFTENETNTERLFGVPNASPYVKDGINDAVVNGRVERVNPEGRGTKVAAHFQALVPPGEALVVWTRFVDRPLEQPFADFEAVFRQRIAEANEFYAAIQPAHLTKDQRRVQRQAFAGLLWNKQFYHYSIELWLDGDPAGPKPPEVRREGRNADWQHLYNLDVLSMPDKWEYPWYAAWDLAFHMVPMALLDPEWAKRQMILLLREWYMHPNGQLPAYEWDFGDVNPPVQAWAAWQVYKITQEVTGQADTLFLERVFHKLLLNFTWWVNRKDNDGNNVFQGGFLGLDNIGVFDRSRPLPTGGHIDQADGTAWMGMYCLNMLRIALELARTRPAYEDVATKFFEHFVYIAHALRHLGGTSMSLWDEEDGFYYDVLHIADDRFIPLKIRSFVGVIPLFAVETLDPGLLEKLPRFRRRMEWFIKYRPRLIESVCSVTNPGQDGRLLLAITRREQLSAVLSRMLDPAEFLAGYGLRSLSKYHLEHPYTFHLNGEEHAVRYEPAESTSGLFGGNSNWRGPIWFPLNYLMIEALRTHDRYYGGSFKVELPTGSGCQATLTEVADELAHRLIRIFLRDEATGRRPVFGEEAIFQDDSHWRDHLLFYEYFHGDTGAGLGASHQTGWTALVAKLLQDCGSKQ